MAGCSHRGAGDTAVLWGDGLWRPGFVEAAARVSLRSHVCMDVAETLADLTCFSDMLLSVAAMSMLVKWPILVSQEVQGQRSRSCSAHFLRTLGATSQHCCCQ